jgi:hypothetical protein
VALWKLPLEFVKDWMKLLQLIIGYTAITIASAASCAKMTKRKEMNGMH